MRVWNFSAGPSALPLEVLEQAAAEMLDYQGSGMSVMEMSHRGKVYEPIRDAAEADLRELLGVSDEYAVLFTQGGAQAQNSLLPLNLMLAGGKAQADYVLSGSWSAKSQHEAARYGDAAIAASSGATAHIDGRDQAAWSWFPAVDTWKLRADSSYVHVCSNETIGGVEFTDLPALNVPLVVDASSNILSRPLDFSRIDMLYAGAQKNAGIAGLTLVVVKRELLGKAMAACPAVFNYQNLDEQQSMYNTPATYSIYLSGLVFQWLKRQGGVQAVEQRNIAKAQLLYNYLDNSGFYVNRVQRSARSRMNIPFQLHDAKLDSTFLTQAEEAGLSSLKGHKSVGGMRASIYNAMPLEGVQALIDFMTDFEKRNG
ncbi:3-phosphoserine/phosphohydroxythreonine transaminase [Alcaligenes endophyticus]|uniref:Phosphoserine aminotransferase n=1 Tax=Alcaligenes endophyticus TaxID=1929088 RepID=A0ABT8EI66_9BURK|nr:3-phosphoserine/phosphohydroxythreonine transaminase [Alcaligenes endophyticus]MCX5592752.1 3-phosphoserine/phosphohydroxythreonine transaminase [Alcaligenes endophyticus]MDN4120940.1 3-phosphoserine/phosphohydroxythreonine transaminase [Alcaligenes endophyticus]